MIGVLRDGTDGDGAGSRRSRRSPTLPALVEESRAAGMRRARRRARRATWPPSRTRSAATRYRIVQEGLTNARKHAPAAAGRPARRAARPGDGLTIEVRNRRAGPGRRRAPAIPGAGTGLVGLAERATLAGGRLEHGLDERGDFLLRAWLPWPRERADPRAARRRRRARPRRAARCCSPAPRTSRSSARPPTAARSPRRSTEHRPDVVLMDIRMPRHRRPRRDRAAARAARRARGHRAHDVRRRRATSCARCAPAPAGSCSRTRRRPRSSAPCEPSPPARRCSRPTITRRLIGHVTDGDGDDRARARAASSSTALTEREREVAVAVGRGKSNAEIAASST